MFSLPSLLCSNSGFRQSLPRIAVEPQITQTRQLTSVTFIQNHIQLLNRLTLGLGPLTHMELYAYLRPRRDTLKDLSSLCQVFVTLEYSRWTRSITIKMCKYNDVTYLCKHDCKYYNYMKPHGLTKNQGCQPCEAAKKRASDSGREITYGPTDNSFCCAEGSPGYEHEDEPRFGGYERCPQCVADGIKE